MKLVAGALLGTPTERFLSLAEACDGVLRLPGADPALLAVTNLHVVSNHPGHLIQHRALLADPRGHVSRSLFTRGTDSLRHLRNLVRGGRGKASSGKRGSVDIVLVAGLVNSDHLDQDVDFYFGALQQAFADRGVTSLLLLRNQTGEPTRHLTGRALRPPPTARALLPDSLRLPGEMRLLQRAVRARAKLARQEGFLGQEGLVPAVVNHGLADALSPSTIANLRLEAQLQDSCGRLQPSLVIVMFEGHVWERCVLRGARLGYPDIRCAGYQHTVVREYSHGVRRRVGMDADPEIILCMGDVTRRMLEETSDLRSCEFLTIGTHRRGLLGRQPSEPRRKKMCLVLAEGEQIEAVELFGFALEAARHLPDHGFIFRTHPILPFHNVKKRVLGARSLPTNVEISRDRSLAEDIERAGWTLYRGSSTVINAILGGLKPFYPIREGELSIDPLYTLDHWREYVSDVGELVRALGRDEGREQGERTTQWQVSGEYCRSYAMPLQFDAIDQLVGVALGGS